MIRIYFHDLGVIWALVTSHWVASIGRIKAVERGVSRLRLELEYLLFVLLS